MTYNKVFKRLKNIYRNMINRCNNYPAYINKKINVCNEWLEDFRNFYYWAINNGFDINKKWYECSIDRINNNKGYSPDNCRWVDMKTQARNKSTNHLITYNGETHCLIE